LTATTTFVHDGLWINGVELAVICWRKRPGKVFSCVGKWRLCISVFSFGTQDRLIRWWRCSFPSVFIVLMWYVISYTSILVTSLFFFTYLLSVITCFLCVAESQSTDWKCVFQLHERCFFTLFIAIQMFLRSKCFHYAQISLCSLLSWGHL